MISPVPPVSHHWSAPFSCAASLPTRRRRAPRALVTAVAIAAVTIAVTMAAAGAAAMHAKPPQTAGSAPTQTKPGSATQAKPRPAAGATAAPAAAPTAPSTASIAKPKQHQATGTLAASAPAQLAILKQFGRNKAQWAFVVNAKTAFDAKPAKGARVRILYHEEKGLRVADRVKILEAAPATSTASASKTAASTSSAAKSSAAKPAPATAGPAPKSPPPSSKQQAPRQP
jgi:hypothetical protein